MDDTINQPSVQSRKFDSPEFFKRLRENSGYPSMSNMHKKRKRQEFLEKSNSTLFSPIPAGFADPTRQTTPTSRAGICGQPSAQSVAELNSQTSQLQAQLSELTDQLNVEKRGLESAKLEIDKQNNKYNLLEKTLKAVRESSSVLENELAGKKSAEKDLTAKIKKEKISRIDSEKANRDLKLKLTAAEKEAGKKFEEKLLQLQNKISNLEQLNLESSAQIDIKDEEIDSFKQQVSSGNNKLDSLNNELDLKNSKLAGLELKLNSIPVPKSLTEENWQFTNFLSLEGDKNILSAKLLSLEADQQVVEASKEKLEKFSVLQAENSNLKREIKILSDREIEFLMLKQENSEANDKIFRLEEKLNLSEAEAGKTNFLNCRILDLEHERDNIEIENEDLKHQLLVQIRNRTEMVVENAVKESSPIERPANFEGAATEPPTVSKSVVEISKAFQLKKQELDFCQEKLTQAEKETHDLKKRIKFLKLNVESLQETNAKFTGDVTLNRAIQYQVGKSVIDMKNIRERNSLIEHEKDVTDRKMREVALNYCKVVKILESWKEYLPETFGIPLSNLPNSNLDLKNKNILDFLSTTQIDKLKGDIAEKSTELIKSQESFNESIIELEAKNLKTISKREEIILKLESENSELKEKLTKESQTFGEDQDQDEDHIINDHVNNQQLKMETDDNTKLAEQQLNLQSQLNELQARNAALISANERSEHALIAAKEKINELDSEVESIIISKNNEQNLFERKLQEKDLKFLKLAEQLMSDKELVEQKLESLKEKQNKEAERMNVDDEGPEPRLLPEQAGSEPSLDLVVLELKENPQTDKRLQLKDRLKSLESDKMKLLAKISSLSKKLSEQLHLAEKIEKENIDLKKNLTESLKTKDSLADKIDRLEEQASSTSIVSGFTGGSSFFKPQAESTLMPGVIKLREEEETAESQPSAGESTLIAIDDDVPGASTATGRHDQQDPTCTAFSLDTTDLTLAGNQIQKNFQLKKELDSLQKESDRKLQTLQKACKKRMDEYKHFVEKVFGFNMNRPRKQYNICSVYGDKSDVIKFSIEDNQDISKIEYVIMKNDFMGRINNRYIDVLNRTSEVPIFLAKYQVGLFEAEGN